MNTARHLTIVQGGKRRKRFPHVFIAKVKRTAIRLRDELAEAALQVGHLAIPRDHVRLVRDEDGGKDHCREIVLTPELQEGVRMGYLTLGEAVVMAS